MKRGSARNDVYEKIYSYAYERRYRINSVKEELIKEKYQTVLFHGSKNGLSAITETGSRIERSFEIDTKLKLTKREFKTGLYIEEILK